MAAQRLPLHERLLRMCVFTVQKTNSDSVEMTQDVPDHLVQPILAIATHRCKNG